MIRRILDSLQENTNTQEKKSFLSRIDWMLLFLALPITIMGLLTMQSYGGNSAFFDRQLAWLGISIAVFFLLSFLDINLLKNTRILLIIFSICIALLAIVFFAGHISHGAASWLSFGGFSVQPSDFVKIALILILAKYFSRRHIAIGEAKHLFISGAYALVPFIFIFLEPALGTAMIIGCIWLGMALVAGIRKRHLLLLVGIAAIVFSILWVFVLKPYQKARIITYVDPFADVHGAGYNARQAMIAVGSGGLLGKGVGYGTQSRLRFLPEYQTDFIFAAFAEEWGYIGALILLILFGLLLARILSISLHGASNFETLFASGVTVLFVSHIVINISMNIGLLPVTGITLPFMSYGGSHLLTEFAALGIISSMRNHTRSTHPEDLTKEFEGL